VEGTIVFAKSGQPDSRTTQIFVNLADNSPSLDPQGFSPFGKVVEGLDVLRKVNAEYGEQPEQNEVRMRGNKYLRDNFPRLDGITKATLVE
ncbi:MAG TPA: peptidylprolyl isomerase, partial [Candidatus Hydrogenedentes bacterium]|nr:peptidylprolyl isomerase [Candidatus Hydrogenedentota bacterium]